MILSTLEAPELMLCDGVHHRHRPSNPNGQGTRKYIQEQPMELGPEGFSAIYVDRQSESRNDANSKSSEIPKGRTCVGGDLEFQLRKPRQRDES